MTFPVALPASQGFHLSREISQSECLFFLLMEHPDCLGVKTHNIKLQFLWFSASWDPLLRVILLSPAIFDIHVSTENNLVVQQDAKKKILKKRH